MLQESIGLIETRGLVGAVCAADAAVKAANINLLPFELIGGGLVSVKFRGDVAAVQVAVQAGIEVARGVSELISHNVIAAPDKALSALLTTNATTSKLIIAEDENSEQNLHELSVTQLRQMVRQRSDAQLKGRDVSRANKQMLIDELKRLDNN